MDGYVLTDVFIYLFPTNTVLYHWITYKFLLLIGVDIIIRKQKSQTGSPYNKNSEGEYILCIKSSMDQPPEQTTHSEKEERRRGKWTMS